MQTTPAGIWTCVSDSAFRADKRYANLFPSKSEIKRYEQTNIIRLNMILK